MTHSETWFQRAQKVTPGGVQSPVRNLNYVGTTPVFFTYGEGAYLHDVDGKSYIDFCQSFGPHILGHCPDVVTRTLKEQVSKATSFGACHPREVELCESISRAIPFVEKVRLLNSGTEAVMTALRIARAYTNRPKIIKFDGCYHGHSDGLLSNAGSGVAELSESTSKGVSQSQVADTLTASFQDLSSLESLFKKCGKDIAAVVLEPIPANNGLFVPTRNHVEQICEMARSHGALVIFDEVISGFRVGLAGASGYFDLKPDLVTLGKIIGGGLPLAAVGGRGAVMDVLAPVGGAYQAGTLSGNPLATAAGCAIVNELTTNPPYERLASETTQFVDQLERILQPRYQVRIERLGSIFWMNFNKDRSFPPTVGEAEKKNYAELFGNALKVGIYLPPSPYEVAFVSTAHCGRVLELALERLRQCVK